MDMVQWCNVLTGRWRDYDQRWHEGAPKLPFKLLLPLKSLAGKLGVEETICTVPIKLIRICTLESR